MNVSHWALLRRTNVSDKIYRENQNTYFMFNNLFSENRAFHEVMQDKNDTTGQATDDNSKLRTRIACRITEATGTYNTYCFSTATVVTRTRLIVTLHVHCLSCFVTLYHIKTLKVSCYQLIANCMPTDVNVRNAMEDVLFISSPVCDLFVINVQQYCKDSILVPLS